MLPSAATLLGDGLILMLVTLIIGSIESDSGWPDKPSATLQEQASNAGAATHSMHYLVCCTRLSSDAAHVWQSISSVKI